MTSSCLQAASAQVWSRLPTGCPGSHRFENCGDALASGDAHGYKGVAATDTVQFVDRLHRNYRASCAHRVAQRDARPVRVNLGRVDIQLADDGAGLSGEGLVRFDDI
jgi:hypothetical protein